MASVYNICVGLIEKDRRHGGEVTQTTIDKIDKFYALGKLTDAEYDTLQSMIGGADE